jgi:hypothetical protein
MLHILLAVNLLISSMGVTIHEHICQKNGTTFTFFTKSHSCCSSKKKKCCSVKKSHHCESNALLSYGTNIKKKPCCEDKSHYSKLNTNASEVTKVVFSELQSVTYTPLVFAPYALNNEVIDNAKTLRFYLYKPPPLYVDNLRVLYQSFLC